MSFATRVFVAFAFGLFITYVAEHSTAGAIGFLAFFFMFVGMELDQKIKSLDRSSEA